MPDPSERPAPPIHLLLTGADCYPPSALPPLPELARALQHWQPQALVHSAHQVPLTLAEQLQADWLGLPGVPGHQPVAALEAQLFDQPCAWLTPCHVQLGMDRAQLHDPASLQLDDAQSRALMDALSPLWADEGVRLTFVGPLRWLAQGDWLADAHGISLAQATRGLLHHTQLTPQVPTQSAATRARLLRLHNEAEMLLYTHPVTDARAAQRLPAVNAIWLHGAGVLPAADAPAIAQRARRLRVDTRLAQAADEGGQPAWQAAWQTVQPELVAQLTAMRGQADARLTLCGDEAAWPLAPASGGLGQRVARRVKPLRLADLLGRLVPQVEAGTAGAAPGARHAL
jgi:hypothetical protein